MEICAFFTPSRPASAQTTPPAGPAAPALTGTSVSTQRPQAVTAVMRTGGVSPPLTALHAAPYLILVPRTLTDGHSRELTGRTTVQLRSRGPTQVVWGGSWNFSEAPSQVRQPRSTTTPFSIWRIRGGPRGQLICLCGGER